MKYATHNPHSVGLGLYIWYCLKIECDKSHKENLKNILFKSNSAGRHGLEQILRSRQNRWWQRGSICRHRLRLRWLIARAQQTLPGQAQLGHGDPRESLRLRTRPYSSTASSKQRRRVQQHCVHSHERNEILAQLFSQRTS